MSLNARSEIDLNGRFVCAFVCEFGRIHSYKRLLIQAGLEASPFARIANRPHSTRQHWRSISDEEMDLLLSRAKPLQHACIMITRFTGLRKSSDAALRWSELKTDKEHDGWYFAHLPPKTARFGRRVEIPVHPVLMEYLSGLPRVDDFVLGFDPSFRSVGVYNNLFSELFSDCGVFSDDRGLVSFGSFRKRFIERCDASGIRRTATRGVVGQVSDDITDIYSSDFEGALAIKAIAF